MLFKKLRHKHRQELYNEILALIDGRFKTPTMVGDRIECTLGYNRAVDDLADAIKGKYIRECLQNNIKIK